MDGQQNIKNNCNWLPN